MKFSKFQDSLEKLSEALNERYGVELFYFPINMEGKRPVALETARRNSTAPVIITHHSMIIPMKVEGMLVGAAEVYDIRAVAPLELSQIKSTVDNVLGSSLFEAHSANIVDEDGIGTLIDLSEWRTRHALVEPKDLHTFH